MWLDMASSPVALPKRHIATAILTSPNGQALVLKAKSVSKEKAT